MANQEEGTHDTKGCLEDPLWFQGKSLKGRILSGDLDRGPTWRHTSTDFLLNLDRKQNKGGVACLDMPLTINKFSEKIWLLRSFTVCGSNGIYQMIHVSESNHPDTSICSLICTFQSSSKFTSVWITLSQSNEDHVN